MSEEILQKKIKFYVEGMDCASCAANIEKALRKLQDVEVLSVNLISSTVEISTGDGLVSSEAVIEMIRHAGFTASQLTTAKSTTFKVEGMDCSNESSVIEKKLKTLSGVSDFRFNLIAQTLSVDHSCSTQDILKSLKTIGFNAVVEVSETNAGPNPMSFWVKYQHMILTGLSGLFIVVAYSHHYMHKETDFLTFPLYAAAMLAGGWFTARKGLAALRNLSLDMNFLMIVAIIGAAAIGEWQEGAMVAFLFSVANLLETYSMDRARRAVSALMQYAPKRVTVQRNGAEIEIDVDEILVGEIIVIKPGEKVPLDGEVLKGNTHIDQAPITGESLPIKKEPGDGVFAGTLNQQGAIEVRVTKLSKDTTLARIIHMIQEAQAQKAPSQRFVDRFAKYYTPLVILISLLVMSVPPLLFGEPFVTWLYRGLVLLVIACPCALVISTPVAIVTALSTAAKNGVLIKGGVYLEAMGSLKAIAFDKTGTLTRGVPRVVEVIPVDSKNEKEILRVAAAIESRSEHHLGKAILEKAKEAGISYPEVNEFEAITGKGVKGVVDGTDYYIGNLRLFDEMDFSSELLGKRLKEIESAGSTVVILGNSRKTLGLIVIADEIREISREALKLVKKAGIRKTVMLTGDNLGTAKAIAEKLDIDDVKAGLLPEDKVYAVKDLLVEYKAVAMVGDGVNDAPALAAATVGIAMGTAGTDAALETADIALMADDLRKLPFTITLSRKTLSVIRQNIFLALAIKVVFLIAAVAGVATLWMAVFADMGASLIVIANGLRLIRVSEK